MKTKLVSSTFLSIGTLLAAAALAGPPVLPTLNPPVSSAYSCAATGSGAVCRAQVTSTVTEQPLGIVCGSAQDPVELVGSYTATLRATRYYDTAGNLARRFRYEKGEGTVINPVTGLTADLSIITDLIDTFAVPGNFDTVTTQQTGPARMTLAGDGVLLLDTGRAMFDAQENVLSSSGHLALLDYWVNGNQDAIAKVCAALGSPVTP